MNRNTLAWITGIVLFFAVGFGARFIIGDDYFTSVGYSYDRITGEERENLPPSTWLILIIGCGAIYIGRWIALGSIERIEKIRWMWTVIGLGAFIVSDLVLIVLQSILPTYLYIISTWVVNLGGFCAIGYYIFFNRVLHMKIENGMARKVNNDQ